uniref:Bm8581, isoform b n=1 Tax=Brugia malayi TaxID=6279 RepID=A0A1I9G035_BRUMA|nr:Bm8581, isoform b [Brugia malayi]
MSDCIINICSNYWAPLNYALMIARLPGICTTMSLEMAPTSQTEYISTFVYPSFVLEKGLTLTDGGCDTWSLLESIFDEALITDDTCIASRRKRIFSRISKRVIKYFALTRGTLYPLFVEECSSQGRVTKKYTYFTVANSHSMGKKGCLPV